MRPWFVALAVGALALPDVAAAQMDWLTPSLENQRAQRIQRHQQRQRAESYQRHQQAEAADRRPVTLAERQAAWSRNKTEYRRRMLRDGPTAADRWLDQIVLAGR